MKNIMFLLFTFVVSTLDCSSSKIPSFIQDESHFLENVQNRKLDSLYREHEKKTSNEIALLVIDTNIFINDLKKYGVEFGKDVGIGKKKKNNGLLIIFCYKCKRIEIVTGKGTEKVLTNRIIKSIIDDNMIPLFKEKRYFEGIEKGSEAIVRFLERPENKIK